MVGIAPGIMVNDSHISADEINAEVQYHPAENLALAKYLSMQALVIRELLIQRVVELGIKQREEALRDLDNVIDTLLFAEVTSPKASSEECRRYYNNNLQIFCTSPLFEVAHILYLAPPEDQSARTKALQRATLALSKIKENPQLFVEIARSESACSSGAEGGRLGQIAQGQTMPEFEKALFSMVAGEMSDQPVPTEVGYHIIRVDERVDSQQLPFEHVQEWIERDLNEKSWNKAFQQYIQLLAGRSTISGFKFDGVDVPLLQ
jgi:peptidyl-prolyl cis-trans isomerase C